MTLSFSALGKHGRLANQLFQVHSTLGLAESIGADAVFPAWPYEQYFTESLPHGQMKADRQIKEQHFRHYDWQIKDSCDIIGYLQSYKYFGSKRLQFKPEFVQAQCDKHPGLFDKPVICCHVRRGDYIGNPNYYQLPVTYYIDSLYRYFPDWKSGNVLFISDDIEYCKVHFECLPNAYFGSGTDIEDMALGSACDDFIIPNSSYGWWVACFADRGKVIHPGHLFTGALSGNDTKDFWPEHWISNKQDRYSIPLYDVTFTIPVFYDHEDRKNNLNLSLCLLQRDFDTSVIICENKSDKFRYTEQWALYMQDNSKHFHRTKMLNDMAKVTVTPIIVNWDCDVIIPPMQILLAVEAIRGTTAGDHVFYDGADMVFPYDGRFGRMPRVEWFKKLEQRLDIGIVGNTEFKNRKHGHNSVGGAVFFNKYSFIGGGMENEKMISFGPEDCERHDRFKTLGYKIVRITGSLFHIDHFCGPNSTPRNPHFKANHDEIKKIRAMSHDQLKDYVDTWSWVKVMV